MLNQDTDTYNLLLAEGSGDEVLYISDKPLGAKFGSADNNFIMSFPFVPANTYYIDDVVVQEFTGGIGPTPTPTPTPVALGFPAFENFETDPVPGAVFQLVTGAAGDVEWSTDQAKSGTHSIHLTKVSAYGDFPRLSVALGDVPASGEVEVQFDTYIVSTGNTYIQFGHFGNQMTQITDGYKIITLGINSSSEYQVYDGFSWANPIGAPVVAALDTWTHHRIIFNQGTRLFSYWQTVDGQSEVQLYDGELTQGDVLLGEAPFNWFSSIPFADGADYYFDNFSINTPGGTPTPTPTPAVNPATNWGLFD